MTTTTEYGHWTNFTGERSPRWSVETFLGDQAAGFDVDGLVDAYAAAINAALPDGITLSGPLFFGPHPRRDDSPQVILDAIKSVDIDTLLPQFDRGE